jgi:hypothetical protein
MCGCLGCANHAGTIFVVTKRKAIWEAANDEKEPAASGGAIQHFRTLLCMRGKGEGGRGTVRQWYDRAPVLRGG